MLSEADSQAKSELWFKFEAVQGCWEPCTQHADLKTTAGLRHHRHTLKAQLLGAQPVVSANELAVLASGCLRRPLHAPTAKNTAANTPER